MSNTNLETIEACQDTLLECLLMILKASNRCTDKNELIELRRVRKKVNRELDRIESAEINTLLMPEQVKKAVDDLSGLTKSIKDETKKIKNATEVIKKAERYVSIASQAIKTVSTLLVYG